MQYKFEKILFIIAIMLMVSAAPARVLALSNGSLDVRISTSSDDAEEYIINGAVNATGSSDLELVEDAAIQVVGLRFQNITIPKDSEITNAYIVFTTDETGSSTTNLTIKCQSADNPPTFLGGLNYDISSRLIGGETTVAWNNVSAWNTEGQEHQTPDLTNIVQEIINRPGWNGGQSIVFIIGGTGTRIAESYSGSSSQAPLLHIEYTSYTVTVCVADGNDDAEEAPDGGIDLTSSDLEMVHDSSDQKVGIRFRNINVVQGAQITNAYITFTTDNSTTSGTTSLKIYGEATADASAFSSTNQDITSRDTTSNYVEWNDIEAWNTEGVPHQTPDLSDVVQEIVSDGGWSANNDMAFIIEGSGARTAWSYDGDSSKAPCLYIEYSQDPIPYITLLNTDDLDASAYVGSDPGTKEFIIRNSGLATMTGYTITISTANGLPWLSVDSTGGTLAPGAEETVTVTYSPSAEGLGVGTYDGTITITHGSAPNSPKEIGVTLSILTLPPGSTCGNVPVYTENLVSPAILFLLDVSSSMTRMMNVSSSEDNPNSDDISAIVQELVDRPDWVNGNAMVFIITGSGHRTACSFDQSGGGNAPILHVTYNGTTTITPVQVSNSSDDAEESSAGGMSLTSSDLELVQDSSTQTVGIRFDSVPVPPGATIDEAYIEFVIDESQSETTNLTIRGQDLANPSTFSTTSNDISSRTLTTAVVPWIDEEEWVGAAQQSRIQIGRDVISDLMTDRSISWGYGTWCSNTGDGYNVGSNYTKIHVGCKNHDDAHQADLQAAVLSTDSHSGTPFGYSLIGARTYFEGNKDEYVLSSPGSTVDPDKYLGTETGDSYNAVDCQPMFLIDVTDGEGYFKTVQECRDETNALYDAGVSCVAVGFGIDSAARINAMAEVSNIRGNASTTDSLYALHDEVAGVGQPFFANNKEDLVDALSTITEKIKASIFHGSSPAPTTSSDLGDSVLIAKFDASDWTGDLVAITKTVGTLKVDDITGTFQDDELLTSLGGEARVDGTLSGNYLDYDGKESSFSVGQEVTGGSSGATGTIDYISISGLYTGTLELSNITGAFTDDEIITSVAGSATEDGILRRNLLKYGTKTADFVVGEVITGQTSGTIGTIDSIDIINSGYGTLQLSNVFETYDLRYDAKTVDFSVGEVVTGDTSSATGTVFSIRVTGATTGTLRLSSVSGTFDDNEALSGDSGGTATAYGRLSDEILFEEDEDLTGDSGGAARANSELYNALSYDALTSEFNVNETVVGGTSGAEAVIVEVVEAWELDNYAWAASDEMPDAALKKVFTVTDPADPGSWVQYTDALLPDDNFLCKPLGDIINSTPIVVGSPPYWYDFDNYDVWKRGIERDPVVYIGANDGFLHALSLNQVVESGFTVYEPGEEKWAFLPNNLQAKLDLASDPTYDMCDSDNYCHQYFVDGSPKVADIYNGTDWKTLLVCGEGEGGEAYFGLDVTSGKSFDDATDPSVFLWEFTDSDLGQTLGEPAIARIFDITLGCSTWGVFFGSGYSPTDQANKTACLYGIQAHSEDDLWYDWGTGTSYNKIELTFYSLSYDAKTADFSVGEHVTGLTSGAIAMIVSIDADISSGTLELENVVGSFQDNEALIGSLGGAATVDGTLGDALLNNALASPATLDFDSTDFSDHIYVGDLYGTMYRVSNIGKGYTPWVSNLFRFDAFPSSPNIHPIRAKATFAYTDVPGYVWVYFGTGRYETQADKTSMSQQYMFGIKEDHGAITNIYNETSGSGLVTLEARYVTDPITGRQLRYIYGPNPLRQSWALKLDRGDFPNSPTLVGSERVIEQALVAGGILFFATFIPDLDVCAGNGDTWLFALDYKSGLAPSNPVFDINGDGKIDKNDVIPQDMDGDGDIEDGEGIHIAAIPIGSGQGSKPVLFGDTLFITTTGGGLTTLPVNLPETRAQLRFWRHNN